MENTENINFIYGKHPIMEAIKNGADIDKIYVLKGSSLERDNELRGFTREHNVHLQIVPKERFQKWQHLNHQGIIAEVSKIEYVDFEEVLPEILASNPKATILIIDGVTDVRNIGAIARSAVCFGAQLMIVPTKGIAKLGSEAIKASAGALNTIAIARVNNLSQAIGVLQNNDIEILAGDLQSQQSIKDLSVSGPKALIIGSEDKGVSTHLLKTADMTFKIPQVSSFDSLNVSVATGIMLYELADK